MAINSVHAQCGVTMSCAGPPKACIDQVCFKNDASKLQYEKQNNCKFTNKGLLSVTLDSEKISNGTINLKVQIQDNGIGIAESDLKNIFKSYYQGAVSEKVNDLGVGLGLNLCKEIIELFKGKINVQSTEGKGTTLKFNLILEQPKK